MIPRATKEDFETLCYWFKKREQSPKTWRIHPIAKETKRTPHDKVFPTSCDKSPMSVKHRTSLWEVVSGSYNRWIRTDDKGSNPSAKKKVPLQDFLPVLGVVSEIVWSHLTPFDVCQCSLVCTRWNEKLSGDVGERVWQRMFHRYFPIREYPRSLDVYRGGWRESTWKGTFRKYLASCDRSMHAPSGHKSNHTAARSSSMAKDTLSFPGPVDGITFCSKRFVLVRWDRVLKQAFFISTSGFALTVSATRKSIVAGVVPTKDQARVVVGRDAVYTIANHFETHGY